MLQLTPKAPRIKRYLWGLVSAALLGCSVSSSPGGQTPTFYYRQSAAYDPIPTLSAPYSAYGGSALFHQDSSGAWSLEARLIHPLENTGCAFEHSPPQINAYGGTLTSADGDSQELRVVLLLPKDSEYRAVTLFVWANCEGQRRRIEYELRNQEEPEEGRGWSVTVEMPENSR